MERTRSIWTLAIVSVALFMVTLDNLVVTNALVSIREDLGATLEELEWTVNAYTLSFAVFLLTGAALGDRFGRRRMFAAGLVMFTVASAAAALSSTTEALIASRAVQGFGAAIVTPLTLTLLSEAFTRDKRGLALGIWSGVSGLGVALGPVVGGAVVEGFSWQWIFWLNVPIGIALAPTAIAMLRESHGPSGRLDGWGVALASTGLFGVVLGIVRAQALGWTSTMVLTSIGTGIVLLAAFVAWELRAPAPMLPMRFFRNRGFAATNVVSLAMFFGSFGSIFLLAQFFQVAQGYSPLEAGLRTLPWTAMPIFVAPIAGLLSDRIGSRPLMAAGLTLQAAGLGVARRGDRAGRGLQRARARLRHGGLGDGARFRSGGQRDPQLGAPPPRQGRRPARRTRSARSAACSAWPCSPRCSPARAASGPRTSTSTDSCRRSGSGRRCLPSVRCSRS